LRPKIRQDWDLRVRVQNVGESGSLIPRTMPETVLLQIEFAGDAVPVYTLPT